MPLGKVAKLKLKAMREARRFEGRTLMLSSRGSNVTNFHDSCHDEWWRADWNLTAKARGQLTRLLEITEPRIRKWRCRHYSSLRRIRSCVVNSNGFTSARAHHIFPFHREAFFHPRCKITEQNIRNNEKSRQYWMKLALISDLSQSENRDIFFFILFWIVRQKHEAKKSD